MDQQRPGDVCYGIPPSKDTEQRTEFFPQYCQAKAYPSLGGIVIGHFTAVQLKQLGLSNMESAPRLHDDDEEDDLALAMMRQGAHWWPSWRFYEHHYERLTDALVPYGFHFPPKINTGYPSSSIGVWVLKFSEDRMDFDADHPLKPYLERVSDGWYGRINMAVTADERCEVLKSFGARFHETVDDCEDIPRTLKEGHERGKRYEQLLLKMEDDDYRERWLEHGIVDGDE